MAPTTMSKCGRFVVIDQLHVDRNVFDLLANWAADRGVGIQDAIQLALCAFNDRAREQAQAQRHRESA